MSATTTRRALIGAIAASPMVALVDTAALANAPMRNLPTVGETTFAVARGAVEKAQQAAKAYRRDVFNPAWSRYEAVRGSGFADCPTPAQAAAIDATGFDQAEEGYDVVLDALWDAQEAMLLALAPDAASIAYKLDVMIAEETWHDTHAPAVMAQLRADVTGLAGEGR